MKSRDKTVELKSTIETITPLKARRLLGKTAGLQRTLNEKVVLKYARDIKDGAWVLNGESIKLTKDGHMADGQHRCAAVISANKAIETVVTRGVEEKDYFTIDTHKPRTAADALHSAGYKDTSLTAGMVRAILNYEKTGYPMSSLANFQHTNRDILSRVLFLSDSLLGIKING